MCAAKLTTPTGELQREGHSAGKDVVANGTGTEGETESGVPAGPITVGMYTGIVYRAIRDGSLIKVVIDVLGDIEGYESREAN